MNIITRRSFLAASGAATAGALLTTPLGTRLALAQTASKGDVIVLLFLRGGADGLGLTPPFDYPSYHDLRPTIGIPPPNSPNGALPLDSASSPNAVFPSGLDGVLGLHPALKPIHDTLWKQGNLAIIPATGMPPSVSATRSHFTAELLVERGQGKIGASGTFMGRMIKSLNVPGDMAAVSQARRSNPFSGAEGTVAVRSLPNFEVGGFPLRDRPNMQKAIVRLNSGESSVARRARTALGVADTLKALSDHPDLKAPTNDDGTRAPGDKIATSLRELAVMLNANLGIRAAAVDYGGWDHHAGLGVPGDPTGKLHTHATDLAYAVRQFADLTNQLDGITVMIITEFGRTIHENGSVGTDHGRAATHFVVGKGIQGGVFGDDYPDEIKDDSYFNDLAVLTDYRKIVSEVAKNRAGLSDLGALFPTYTQNGMLGLTRS